MELPPGDWRVALLHICYAGFLIAGRRRPGEAPTMLLIDPFWGPEFTWKAHRERHLDAPGINPKEINPLHAVLLTHEHADHADARALRVLFDRTRTKLRGPASAYRVAVGNGLDTRRIRKLESRERARLGPFEVLALPNRGSEEDQPCLRFS